MGGWVPAPPPGTRAVLNLCEFADDFEVEVQQWSKIRDAAPAPTIAWLRNKWNSLTHSGKRVGKLTYIASRELAERAWSWLLIRCTGTVGRAIRPWNLSAPNDRSFAPIPHSWSCFRNGNRLSKSVVITLRVMVRHRRMFTRRIEKEKHFFV